MDKVEYHFQLRGSTVGAVSGSSRSWRPGDTQVLPKGELKHVPPRHYETRPLTPSEDEDDDGEYKTRPLIPDESGREYEKNGAYKHLYVEGDLVEENVRCTKDEAEAWKRGDLSIDDLKE